MGGKRASAPSFSDAAILYNFDDGSYEEADGKLDKGLTKVDCAFLAETSDAVICAGGVNNMGLKVK